MVDNACAVSYTADINLVSGTTTSGPTRQRWKSLGAPTSGTWSRVADEISDAQILLDTTGDCGAELTTIWPYLGYAELVIYRDGVTVHAGPITNISQSERGQPATVTSQDVGFWLTRMFLGGPIGGFAATDDPSQVALAAIEYAIANVQEPDRFRTDSGLLSSWWGFSNTGGGNVAYVNEDRWSSVAEVLNDLVDYGMTWTVNNYRLLVGPRPSADTVPVETVHDDDFDTEIETVVSIEDAVTYSWGVSQGGSPGYGESADGEQLPLLATVVEAGDVTDQTTLRRAAAGALEWPVQPTVSSPSGKMLRAPDFSKAIPGRVLWEVQTEFLGQRLRSPMVLESMQVDFTAEGEEQIQPGLTPIGQVSSIPVP